MTDDYRRSAAYGLAGCYIPGTRAPGLVLSLLRYGRRGAACLLLALAMLVFASVTTPGALHACGGCYRLPYQSLLEKVERADRVVVAHSADSTGASWQIEATI